MDDDEDVDDGDDDEINTLTNELDIRQNIETNISNVIADKNFLFFGIVDDMQNTLRIRLKGKIFDDSIGILFE